MGKPVTGKALIFDMDGVIIDSNPFHRRSWKHFLTKRGIPYSDALFDRLMSGKTGETTLRLLIDPELPEAQIREYLGEVDGHFQESLRKAGCVEPVPGLPVFLETARQSGIQTALATSAPPGNVELVLDRLQLHGCFDVILDSTGVRKGKPEPDIYLAILAKLGVEAGECLVLEDSMAGIQSALRAGIKVVGVPTGHTPEALLDAGVSAVIRDFTELNPEELFKKVTRASRIGH